MRLVGALLCVLALACCTQGQETGTSKRLLAQDSTPLALNITLVGVTVIKPEQADLIRDALLDTLPEPKPSQAAVSSNTAIQNDTLTLIILVYPPSDVNSSSLQASLQALDTSAFSSRLNALQLPTTSTRVNKVTPQPQNQYQRDPLTGASLAGVLAVIAVGVILVATAAAFGVRSLFQIRDQMAKAKAGYSTVELSDPHQNMETGMLPEDSSPRHSPMAGSPKRGGREDGKQH